MNRLTPLSRLSAVILCVAVSVVVSFVDKALGALQAVSPPVSSGGSFPTGIALKPDGTKLYVVNANPFSSPRRGNLTVIDTATKTIDITAPLGLGSTEQVAVISAGNRAYVAVENRVDAVDLVAGAVLGITVDSNALMSDVVISPDNKRVYSTDRNGDKLVAIDSDPTSGTFNTVIGSVPTGHEPYGIGMSPDGATLYVANRASSTLTVIQTTPLALGPTIPLSNGPGAGTTQVAVTADGSRAFVTNSASNLVSVVDTVTNQEVDTIETAGGPLLDVTIAGNPNTILVTALSPTNTLLRIDVNAPAVLDTVPVPNLGFVAFSGAPSAFAYVTTGGDPGQVVVIGGSTCNPPRVVFSNNRAFGLFEGVVTNRIHEANSTTAKIQLRAAQIFDIPLLRRGVLFWVSIDSITADPSLVSVEVDQSDTVGGFFAELGLIPPGSHAGFVATFCGPSTATFDLGFNRTGIIFTMIEAVVPILPLVNQLTPNDILTLVTRLDAIPLVSSATTHISNALNLANEGRAGAAFGELARAVRDVVLLAINPTQRRQLVNAFVDLGVGITAEALLTRLLRGLPVRLYEVFADVIILDIQTSFGTAGPIQIDIVGQ